MLLAGNIGGTKTDPAIYSNETGPHAPLAQAEVHSADYPSLQALMNDLDAIAEAIPILRDGDVLALNAGQPVPKGVIGVIAPGAGLGESFLTWDESHYVAHSSEGGHADFAPTDERQISLLRHMLKRFDHVSVEHVCSGSGRDASAS